MYGSDHEYENKQHEYKPCHCCNPVPHCWYCGKIASDDIHSVQIKTNE